MSRGSRHPSNTRNLREKLPDSLLLAPEKFVCPRLLNAPVAVITLFSSWVALLGLNPVSYPHPSPGLTRGDDAWSQPVAPLAVRHPAFGLEAWGNSGLAPGVTSRFLRLLRPGRPPGGRAKVVFDPGWVRRPARGDPAVAGSIGGIQESGND